MEIEFEKMKKNIRYLYEIMWGKGFDGIFFDGIIDKTYDVKYKKKTDNSYSFVGNGCKAQILSTIFEIENKELFCSKYYMATSGAGKEGNRILTLHSSSLCALLHFYNVTKGNPLILILSTNKKKRKVMFTQSIFEYKSPVIKGPSNMDVVLIGQDMKNGEKVVFFLESKFSEYYTSMSKKSDKINVKYLDKKFISSVLYEEKVLEKLKLKVANKGNEYFYLESEKDQFYITGIKQMISHFMGIKNVLSGKYYNGCDADDRQSVVEDEIKNGAIAILGEIIFDFDDRNGELKECQEIYSSKYAALANQMSELIEKNEKLEILKNVLKYSEIKQDKYIIEDRIQTFYREDV